MPPGIENQQVAHIRLGGMMWPVWHAPVGRWNTG
jgi:hypothetical protein